MFSGKARSATVLQFKDDSDEPVALRENAAYLESGYVPDAVPQQSPGEWDFLLQKHKDDRDSEALPCYGESETGDEACTAPSIDTEDDDDLAEESDSGFFNAEGVDEIIERSIKDCVANWQKDLPRLESKKASGVWKRMKQSRTVRSMLIEGAQARIEHLTHRLCKMKNDMLSFTWESEQSLLQRCGILEPTVQDREEQRWMIEIWRRTQEPSHTVQHGVKKNRLALETPASHKENRGPILYPDDRFSVSPAKETQAPVENDIEEETRYEADDEEFHTPINSPGISPDVDADEWVLPDEMDLEYDGVDHGELVEGETEGAPATFSGNAPNNLKDASSGNDSRYSTEAESESEELPESSTFVKQRKPFTPAKAPAKSTVLPIDLTVSSSDSSPPFKRVQKSVITQKPTPLGGDPTNATAAEVDSWNFSDLARADDRQRILIKLLRDAGPEFRERLHNHLRSHRKVIVKQLKKAFQDLRTGDIDFERVEAAVDKPMLFAAKMYLHWSLPMLFGAMSFEDVSWDSVCNDGQLSMFSNMLGSFLQKNSSKLFADRKPSSMKPSSSSAPIPISSSDEVPRLQHTPHKIRKKEVRRSTAAHDTRKLAFDRQERYKGALEESQTVNSSQLAAMIASDPSVSCVAINPVRGDAEDPIYIYDRIAKKMKAHQIDGARFLWREISAEGDDGGQGCILAHTMGLGKTMQTIALLVAAVEASSSKDEGTYFQLPGHLRPKEARGTRRLRILILCPPTLLQNWRREIDRWAPKMLGDIFILDSTSKASHLQQLERWMRLGGVLLVGYQMYRLMIVRKARKPDQRSAIPDEVGARIDKILLEGTEIVVADEAHNLKNDKSAIAKAAARIQTQSRIGLTGTPMSNDVEEIYALVSWVAPGYLGDPQEFRAHYTEPIKQGLYRDSSYYERRQSFKRLTVLHAEIQPKVDRATIEVLKGSLKPKVEFVITVPLGSVQLELYRRYIKAVHSGDRSELASQVRIFSWLAMLTLLTNHPRCFRHKLLTPPKPPTVKNGKRVRAGQQDGVARDQTPSTTTESGAATPMHQNEITTVEQLMDEEAANDDWFDGSAEALGFSEEMIQEILDGFEDDINPKLSSKVAVFLNLLMLSLDCNDKALVFSSSIPTLDYLDELFRQDRRRYGRIDGQIPMGKRLDILEDFNNGKLDIMLVSTKAGGVGLNIQGANRVFIFDFGFNPTLEEQAIGRAYRLGQTKPVFVYRFMAGGTFETNIYNKQLFKSSLAQRVVDKKNPRRNAERDSREYLYEPKEVPQKDFAEGSGKDPLVLDRLLEQHGPGEDGKVDTLIRAIKTMETLQEEVQDDPLNEEEHKEVRQEIELRKTRWTSRRPIHAGGPSVTSTAPAYNRSGGASVASAPAHKSRSGGVLTPPPPAPPASMQPYTVADAGVNSDPAQQPFMGGLPMSRIPRPY